jgi:hypothetical protein
LSQDVEGWRSEQFADLLKQHRKLQLDYTQHRKDITSKDAEIEKLKAQVGAIHGKPLADTVLHLLS